jgi:hypothetical protein
MSTRKRARSPEDPTPPPAAGASPDDAGESSTTEPTPVKKIRVRPQSNADRPRAGGHVLTERGWIPENRQEN